MLMAICWYNWAVSSADNLSKDPGKVFFVFFIEQGRAASALTFLLSTLKEIGVTNGRYSTRI